MNRIYAQHTTTVTELKKAPSSVLQKSDGKPVAVLANNTPRFYVVDAGEYEDMMMIMEVFQRGNAELKAVPGSFRMSKERMTEASSAMMDKIASGESGEFVECR